MADEVELLNIDSLLVLVLLVEVRHQEYLDELVVRASGDQTCIAAPVDAVDRAIVMVCYLLHDLDAFRVVRHPFGVVTVISALKL